MNTLPIWHFQSVISYGSVKLNLYSSTMTVQSLINYLSFSSYKLCFIPLNFQDASSLKSYPLIVSHFWSLLSISFQVFSLNSILMLCAVSMFTLSLIGLASFWGLHYFIKYSVHYGFWKNKMRFNFSMMIFICGI